MGCVCAKQGSAQEDSDSPKEKQANLPVTTTNPRVSTRRPSVSVKVETEPVNGFGEKPPEKPKPRAKPNGTVTTTGDADEVVARRRERLLQQQQENPRLSNPPKNIEGEQIAAGWPAWLSAVAGEAIKGWIPRRADSFEKLDKIGQGTYSNVYKARDLDTGKIVALKKVRFDNLEPESVRFMAREIQVLRRLDHPNVVKLEGLVTSRMSCSLYLVFEYMEHDLAGLAACPGIMFTEAQVKCYLQQLLRGLDHCHSRGVLHRDIKGSNLLLDNGGILKIADFGLATFYHPDQKQPLTSRVVTLWYRPPELLLGATEYGAAVDLWSTGCILAELLAGKPIMPGRTEVEQLHKIFKLCGSPSEEYWRKSKLPHATIFKPQQPYKRCIADTFKEFPNSSLALLETLLAIEPADRGSAAAALKSEFFTSKPLACDPSSLPQYPPSKEFDAKIRDEEARRQRAQGGRTRGSDAGRRPSGRDRISKAVPAPDANAELPMSMHKRRMNSQASSKSKSEKFAPLHEDSAVGFPIDPPRQGHITSEVRGTSPVPPARPFAAPSVSSRSGPQPMVNPNLPGASWAKKHKEEDLRMAPQRPLSRPTKSMTVSDFTQQAGYQQSGGDLSNFSSLVAARNGAPDHHRERGSSRRDRDGADGEPIKRESHISKRDPSDKHDRSDRLEKRDHRTEMSSFKRDQGSDGPYQRDHSNADSHRREGRKTKDIPMGIPQHTERIFHSGPLLHQGYTASVDIEELLEDHERQVKQAARRAGEVRNSSGHGHKGGWNHVRSNGAAAQENTDSAESNGLVPTSGHHLISHQKRSKSRMMEQGLDSREAREVRDLEKETPPYGSEAHVKVQEV
ncbi:cyclin-dependent kinase 12/13 [Marchantia polymorpha subsp. ruderalis]|uniref:Protein kinase domain-containing protein n=2 Tax=Marchantia polymorpha TaxID=3197 RepID=A0AAF6B1J6_MARPO|nr:hypothetical protein MARPO_0004s0006 [Marchantia polymorpha]BBN05880.1 hypothetical protein Mp_3g16650 [Marchantia polymorpha subsp. ruderalis]|eukprot:PTQ48696.1 hypothetical protein MARPO_0004s0006 [Marchantia polymorpha]